MKRSHPPRESDNPLQALIFDSVYDSYKGVIIFCRVMEGTVKKGTMIRMMATGAKEEVVEVGYFGADSLSPDETFCRNGRLHHGFHQECKGILQWVIP